MFCAKLSIIAYILIVSFIYYDTEATCLNPFFNKHALSPINIDSSKVIQSNLTTPLILFNALFDIVNFTNTGKTLDAYSDQLLDPSFITGGILCDKKYKIHTIRFYINPRGKGRSGNTVDGQGAPLEMTVIYYNILYGSMENALRFPDGITVLGFPVKVNLVPNLGFLPLQFILSTGVMKKPGSSIPIPGLFTYVWFDNLLISPVYKYYAYTGTYYDPETGKQTPSANYLFISPDQALSLSYKQFAVFKKVLGLNGKPLNSVPPIYPHGSTKVYELTTLIQVLLPVV
ncbi:carbonic anhydrase 2-like [Planococcus citri]|uniref:carbonic anhydrase 2-like n=1 Tax=Planococcus citri TaxID=170843 RepID=UPI0031F7329C